MRRKGLWLSVLATALIAGNASAATVTVNSTLAFGGGFEWLTYDTSVTPTSWWRESNVSLNTTANSPILNSIQDPQLGNVESGDPGLEQDFTYPAFGGQKFDVEQVLYGFTGNSSGGILYVGIVTGFDPGGVSQSGNYFAGDFFLDFGGLNPGYDLAFGTSDDAASGPETSTRRTQAWDLSSPWTVEHVQYPAHYSASDPYRVDTTQSNASYGMVDTDYDVEWITNFLGTGDHNLLQIGVRLNATQATALRNYNGFSANWTMSCGNDVIPIDASLTVPNANIVPVPAAAPLGLLGMGLLALVRRVRRRSES